jgi:hypothetical protein
MKDHRIEPQSLNLAECDETELKLLDKRMDSIYHTTDEIIIEFYADQPRSIKRSSI